MSIQTTPGATRFATVVSLEEARSRSVGHQSPRMRLTRRGRMVFGVMLAALITGLVASAAIFGATQAVATSEAGSAEFGYVVVQPGASLWSVATELDPNADPRDVVAELVRLNQLGGSGVQAGQPIAVPLRYSGSDGVVSATDLGLDS